MDHNLRKILVKKPDNLRKTLRLVADVREDRPKSVISDQSGLVEFGRRRIKKTLTWIS